MQMGAALKKLLEFNAELGPVLAAAASGEMPAREQAARLAAKQTGIRGQLLQLKPTKLGCIKVGHSLTSSHRCLCTVQSKARNNSPHTPQGFLIRISSYSRGWLARRTRSARSHMHYLTC